jgi:Tol biopolymer transport system component
MRRRLELELLEDRLAPALQVLSLADPSLFATGAAGDLSGPGRTISDDGRFVVYDGGDNVVPNDHNYTTDVFVRDLQTGAATLVSVNQAGTGTGNAGSGGALITPSGRFVVFSSNATDLVSGDTSASSNIFVRDLVAGTTTLVSMNTSGNGGNSDSFNPVITPDGRFVAFESYARDLVAGDTSLGDQIYLRDLVAGTTTWVSVGQGAGTFIASDPLVSDNGQFVAFQSRQLFSGATTNIYLRKVAAGTTALVSVNATGTGSGNLDSTNPVMTPDGRYVAFVSLANNLVAGDTNGAYDVFVRDLAAQKTILVSMNGSGKSANGSSGVDGRGNTENPCISSDGRYVAFNSDATDLTGGASNPLAVFVRDLVSNTTTEVSLSTTGSQPNSFSEHPFMSPDGNFVGFQSFATNLVSVPPGTAPGENLFVRNRSAGTTALVTVNSTGSASANGTGFAPYLTSNGQYVAFESNAQDLVAQDGDNLNDVFVRDLGAQTTTLVSTHDVNLPSLTGNGSTDLQPITNQLPQISTDGRYFVFTTGASNLVPGQNNGQTDIFVADSSTGKLTLASVNQAGTGSGNGGSQRPVLSADGRYVAFDSFATDLISLPDNNPGTDVFERDLASGTTTLISINMKGTATGAGTSAGPVISPDGRFVAFQSNSPDLTSNPDPHFTWNIFLRDTVAGTTTLVSVNPSGAAGNAWSGNYHITPDGRYVVFQSNASDLVPGDTNGYSDVFVRDLVAGTTTLVSVNSSGTGPGNGASDNAQITPDGRFVVFESSASNLVPGGTSGATNVYVRDLLTGTTTLVNMNQAGTGAGNAAAQDPSISTDGRYVAFDSTASDLVVGDTNGVSDVFVRDLVAGTTTLVSVNTAGTASGDGPSQYPTLSPDGSHVAFASAASNLVTGDTNGTYENVFLRDLATGTTTLLDSHASKSGSLLDQEFALSADGQHAALSASGDDLSAGDYNYFQDVYLWGNAPPVAQPGGLYSVPEGGSVTLDGSGSKDPDDAIVSYAWDTKYDGSNFTVDATGAKPTFSASNLDGPQTLTVALRVTDQFGLSSIATTTITVTNVPPTATLTNDGPVTAGNPVTVAFSNASDPSSADSQAGFTYSFALTPAGLATNYASAGNASSAQFTFDTSGSYTLYGRIFDKDNGFTDYTTIVTVNPGTASQFSISVPVSSTAGSAFSVTVTALDAFNNVATGYTGTVEFTSSDGQATLPGNYTFTGSDAGVHTFTNGVTLDTAGNQTVTATDSVTASIMGAAAVTVSPGVAASLQVAVPASSTAGTAFTATVTAVDAFGNTATGYTGTVHFSSSDGQATLPGDYAFTTDDQGSHSFTNAVTLDTAGSQSVSAIDSANSLTGSGTVTVSPATATHYLVTAPQTATAGTAITVTLTALDQFGNTATGYTGTAHFTSSDGQAALPGDYTFTANDAGTQTFSVTLMTAGTQSLTATDTNTGSVTGTQTGIRVNPAAANSLVVGGYPSPATAGASQTFTVTAQDAYGNVATGYAGTVHFTSSDGQADLPGDYIFTGDDAGVHSFSGTLKTAGIQSITATDTATAAISGSQTGITVTPAAASSLAVTGYSSPTTAGLSHNFSVSAKDAYGNTATGYTGTVHFSSSDGQAALPGDYTFIAGDGGTHTVSVTLKTAGSQSITATDTATATITGNQSGILVNPAAAVSLAVTGFPSPTTAGASHNFTVTARDAYGNTATGYRGTVHFTSSDGQAALPANYTFTATDAGVHTFSATLKTAGTRSLTATDTATASITGTQGGITVNAAAASSFVVTGYPSSTTAGVSHTFTVTARDAYGNVATSNRGTVHFTSSDGQAALPANYTFTAADAGVHTFNATLKTAGNQSITATDTTNASITGTQTGITVAPAAATQFRITAPPSASVGAAFTITITALDAYGNVATGYRGKVHFTSTDRKATLPADYTFTSGDSGTHSFTIILRSPGSQTITATDATTSSITGSAIVTVSRH